MGCGLVLGKGVAGEFKEKILICILGCRGPFLLRGGFMEALGVVMAYWAVDCFKVE